MIARILTIGVLLSALGCATEPGWSNDGVTDPAAPSASGMLALAPGVATDGYVGLAVRLGTEGDPYPQHGDMAVPMTWPISFGVGGGLGRSDTSDFVVRAWLETVLDETSPGVGAPHAEAAVRIPCGPPLGSCDSIDNVMLTLTP